jgi:hypothetical protein
MAMAKPDKAVKYEALLIVCGGPVLNLGPEVGYAEGHRQSLQTKSRDSTTTHTKPSLLNDCPPSIIRTIQFYNSLQVRQLFWYTHSWSYPDYITVQQERVKYFNLTKGNYGIDQVKHIFHYCYLKRMHVTITKIYTQTCEIQALSLPTITGYRCDFNLTYVT